MTHTFTISKAPATYETLANAKRKPKSDTDNGALVKRFQLWLNVDAKTRFAKAVQLFPGISPMALEECANGPGFDARSKKKLGQCTVQLFEPGTDESFAESTTAKIAQPRLLIETGAKNAWLILPIEMAIPKKALGVADDCFKADIAVSVKTPQVDLEDEAKAKVKAKQEELAAEPDKPVWTAREKATTVRKPRSPKAAKEAVGHTNGAESFVPSDPVTEETLNGHTPEPQMRDEGDDGAMADA